MSGGPAVRTKRRDYVEATGWTKAEALRDLAGRLGGWGVEEVGETTAEASLA